MAIFSGPEIPNNGLVLNLDAANPRSYLGSGPTWTDLSGLGNNGTLTNGPTYSSTNNGSIVFDRVDDYVNITNSSSLQVTNNLTIVVWFMPYNYGVGRQGLLGKNGLSEYTITLEPSGSISHYFNSANQPGSYYNNASSRAFGQTNNIFQQLCITRNFADLVLIYKNGIITSYSTSLVGVTPPSATTGAVTIGTGNGGNFLGRVGLFQLYNRALSQAEIQQNFEATRGRYGI